MTLKKFNIYTDHIWKIREYLQYEDSCFDYPWYAGLKGKFDGSPEVCDAMQNIWHEFVDRKFRKKRAFKQAYKNELIRIGEKIK